MAKKAKEITFADDKFEAKLENNVLSMDGYLDIYTNMLFFPDIAVKAFESKKTEGKVDEKDDIEFKKEKCREIIKFAFEGILGWNMRNVQDHISNKIIKCFKLDNFVNMLTGINSRENGYSAADFEVIVNKVYPSLKKYSGYVDLDERFADIYLGSKWSNSETRTMRSRDDNEWILYFETFLMSCFVFRTTGELYEKFSNSTYINERIKKYRVTPLFEGSGYPVEVLHSYLSCLDKDENSINADNVIYSLTMINNISQYLDEKK